MTADLFLWNLKFGPELCCCLQELVTDQRSAHCFAQFCNQWIRTNQHVPKLIPVQSSRSKWTTCLRKGRLLQFQSNSISISNCSVQKLGNYFWHDSESKIKVCSQNSAFEKQYLIVNSKIFLAICYWK